MLKEWWQVIGRWQVIVTLTIFAIFFIVFYATKDKEAAIFFSLAPVIFSGFVSFKTSICSVFIGSSLPVLWALWVNMLLVKIPPKNNPDPLVIVFLIFSSLLVAFGLTSCWTNKKVSKINVGISYAVEFLVIASLMSFIF